jgi:hypothetical protein
MEHDYRDLLLVWQLFFQKPVLVHMCGNKKETAKIPPNQHVGLSGCLSVSDWQEGHNRRREREREREGERERERERDREREVSAAAAVHCP